MNAPLRRIAMFCIVLVVSVMVSTTWIQFVEASDLNSDQRNARTLIELAGQHRGAITAGPAIIAESVPVNDKYGNQRMYPGNQLYSHVTGFYTIYGTSSGLEQREADMLTGTSDVFFYRRVSDLLTGKDPLGATVETTINPAAQQAAWDALGDQRGAVVALNPQTGEILAMVSKPAYDPNVLASHASGEAQKAYNELEADPNKPLYNRAIGGNQYPPGSVFKIITAAAALESGQFNANSMLFGGAEYQLPGSTKTIRNASRRACGEGDQATLADALRQSCNTPFAKLAVDLGADVLREEAAEFGFGEDLRVPLRVVPSTVPEGMDGAQLAMAAIGQYDVRVTPLQVAMMSAAVANNGVIMTPYLVKTVRAEDQTVLREEAPKQFSRPLSPRNAATLRSMMRNVVENGTAKRVALPGVAVAAKTGTAQHAPDAPPHAWFTAFAPAADADKPQVAVAVVVESGGQAGDEASGGRTAGPIAQKVIEAVLGQ